MPSLVIFPIFFKYWQIVDCDLLKAGDNTRMFFVDYIPPILLKLPAQRLFSVLVLVHSSMKYYLKETLKNEILAITTSASLTVSVMFFSYG